MTSNALKKMKVNLTWINEQLGKTMSLRRTTLEEQRELMKLESLVWDFIIINYFPFWLPLSFFIQD